MPGSVFCPICSKLSITAGNPVRAVHEERVESSDPHQFPNQSADPTLQIRLIKGERNGRPPKLNEGEEPEQPLSIGPDIRRPLRSKRAHLRQDVARRR